jgi:hypothetical protein
MKQCMIAESMIRSICALNLFILCVFYLLNSCSYNSLDSRPFICSICVVFIC